jgi:hypothetical protein
MINMLQMTTSNGRQPQKIKGGITQLPLIGSYPNFNFSLGDQRNL